MFWSFILGIAVYLDLRLFTKRERVLLGARSAELGVKHAGAIGIESATGPVKHVEPDESMKLSIVGLIWNFTRHNFIHLFGGPWFVGNMFQDQQDMRMGQSPFLRRV